MAYTDDPNYPPHLASISYGDPFSVTLDGDAIQAAFIARYGIWYVSPLDVAPWTFSGPVGGGDSTVVLSGNTLSSPGFRRSGAIVMSVTMTGWWPEHSGLPAGPHSDSVDVVIDVAAVLTVSCNTPPDGRVGDAYTHTFLTNGLFSPLTFSISAGALPDGLTLNPSTGVVSGTPTTPGTFDYTVSVIHYLEDVPVTCACSITIAGAGALAIDCGNPPDGKLGTAYTHTFPVTGGSGPFTVSVTAGALPDGLTLDPSTGIVSGTPTATGVFNFTLTASDLALSEGVNVSKLNAYAVLQPPEGVRVSKIVAYVVLT